MFHVIGLKVAKFQQPLLITLGVADEKPEGGGGKKPPRKTELKLFRLDYCLTLSLMLLQLP